MIKWNTVTWYSWAAAVVIYIGTFAFAFYLGAAYNTANNPSNQPSSDPIVISKTSDLTLKAGQSGIVHGLTITFNSLVQDSRCPTDVQCIQAGAVNTNVTFVAGPHLETRNMSSDEVPLHFDAHRISITKVQPPRTSHTEIAPSNYVVTFHVVE